MKRVRRRGSQRNPPGLPARLRLEAVHDCERCDRYARCRPLKILDRFGARGTLPSMLPDRTGQRIRKLAEPARYCNGAFMMKRGDQDLKNMIDNAIMEINSSGQIKDIFSHFMKLDPRYVRAPALPFQEK